MTRMTPLSTAGLAVARNQKAPVASSARFAQTDGRPQRTQPLMRRYEVVHLLSNGDIDDFTRVAPATRSFEDSFSSLARGALLKTNRGEMAIEDILPGDQVKTVTNDVFTLATFIDGVNIVEVAPQTPVQVFQLGFANHERIVANGVELDSHNPGARHELGLRGDMLALYMTLFPHVERIEDFGLLMHPRMSLHDLDFGVVA